MQTTKKLYWLAQGIGWFFYALLTILANYAENPENLNSSLAISLLILITCGIAVTHAMRWFWVDKNWLSLSVMKLIPRMILLSLIAALLLSLVSSLCIHLLIGSIDAAKKEATELTLLKVLLEGVGAFMLMLVWNITYFTYHYFRKSIDQENYNLQLQLSQHEIELKNLRSQLNPHFLFNSLNSIRALIDIEPSRAKQSVTTLSNLLRNSLILGKKEFITLKEEMEVVQSYLNLEKIRFEERLMIEIDVDEKLNNFPLPPFIIQTQAENAIKHGISKLVVGGTVKVEVNASEEGVIIYIKNSGSLLNENSEGIGIENTKRRLFLLYKNNASFDLTESEGWVVCTIKISK